LQPALKSFLLADVSDDEQVNAWCSRARPLWKVDVLMNVAGRRAHQDFWDISYEEWHKTLR
jgi:NAD(P)-dependent dehydrogenase (short-subunit alcohol dehydrogenase family)